MHVVSCLFILFLLLAATVVDAKKTPFESLVKETLRKGIVKLSPRTFQAFVDTGPRNYTLVIELTSLGGSFHCPNCRSSHDEFGLAAASYLSSIGGDLHSAAFLKQPVFFVYMDYSEAMIEYFRKFHLQNVPHFAVVPSTLKESFEPQSKYESGSVKTAEDLAKLVKKAAKVHFSVSRPVWPSLLRAAVGIAIAYVLLFVVIPSIWRNPFNPLFAYSLAMIVFFLSMSGLVFNLIRTPPWSGVNRQSGQREYIEGSSRSQYVAEGMIVAVLMLVAALSHVGLNVVGSRKLSPVVQRVAFYVLLALHLFCLNSLWNVFCIKYSFYPHKVSLAEPKFLKPYLPW